VTIPKSEIQQMNPIGEASDLARRLSAVAPQDLSVSYTSIPGETHTSVIPAYLAKGTRFVLTDWYPQ